jgi:predicted nucleotidyltransferase component of viral defense system
MDRDQEKALLEVIHHISAAFGPEAVLKGGMALRMQGIPRSTIDVDFCFQPHKHKRGFMDKVIEEAEILFDHKPAVTADSKKVQILGKRNGVDIIIEVSAHEGFEPETLSTAAMARGLNLPPRIISVMPKPIAFAHKLGAWLDRRLPRDLYDIHVFYTYLKARPNLEILQKRIENPSYARTVHPKPELKSLESFVEFLKEQADTLDEQILEEDLRGIVDEIELPGIGGQILTTLRRLRV